MKYAYEIISLIAWPIMIYVSYKLSMLMINRFEKNVKTSEDDTSENATKNEN
jgi:hypothetical protein